MTDTAQGPGFELPTYDELTKQLSESGNDKLMKVSQVLMTAQMTHQILSNFKGYKDMVDDLSKSVFDPVKNEMVKGVQKVNEVAGKFAGGNGSSIAPEDLLTMAKNPKAAIKAKMIEATDAGKAKFKALRKQAQEQLDDAMEGKVPQFKNTDELFEGASNMAKKLDISDRIVNDFKDVIQNRFDQIPADMKQQLRDMGITDDELKSVVSGQGNKDLTQIVRQRMGNMKYDDPFETGELDIPEEYLGKIYRANKFLAKLRTPASEGGGLQGDSTIARLTGQGKSFIAKAKAQAQEQLDELVDQPEIKAGKRLQVKLNARSRKMQEQSEIEAAQEKEFPEPARPTLQKPNVQEFEDIPEINLQANASQNTTKSMLSEENLGNDSNVAKTTNNLQKVKNGLEKADEDTSELDETGVGDIINLGLGVATLGTMIAGLFEKPKPQPVVVSGEQLGV